MTNLQFFQLFIVASLISIGQILLKLGANRINLDGTISSLIDIWLILGLGTYGISMLLWLITIKNVPLSLATPISGLTFVMIPILCAIFLDEKLTVQYFAGSLLIVLGISITTRG